MVGELSHSADHAFGAILNLDDDISGFAGKIQSVLGLLSAGVDHGDCLFGQLLILMHHTDDFLCGLGGTRSQLPDFVGDDREAAPLLARTSGFNGH